MSDIDTHVSARLVWWLACCLGIVATIVGVYNGWTAFGALAALLPIGLAWLHDLVKGESFGELFAVPRTISVTAGIFLVFLIVSLRPQLFDTATGTWSWNGFCTIGATLPLIGDDKVNGEAVLNGMKLAVEQENDRAGGGCPGGRKFLIEAKNYGVSDPSSSAGLPYSEQLGVKNIQDFLADSRITAVAGPYNSKVTLAQLPIIQDSSSRLALISPSTTAYCLTHLTHPFPHKK